MVFRRSPHPKLLPLRPLRPQLALSLVFSTRPYLRHRPPRRLLLYRRLGRVSLPLRPPLNLSFLDPPRLRYGLGRS